MEGQRKDGVHDLVARLAAGDVRALARAISVVEDGGAGAAALVLACKALGKRAKRIGVTGPPGVGKSTLVDAMVRLLRQQGEQVGVIAVDPTSPYTGGALLGDRIRMQGFTGDDGVYIRSMASRGALGGLAVAVSGGCAVMEASGREILILETVGVGQDEVAVAELADATVLVLMPGMGDGVQVLKAGVMEMADVYVVNKDDLPGGLRVEEEILAVQGLLSGAASAPVLRTVAATGQGISELLAALAGIKGGRRAGVAGARLDHLGLAVRSIAETRRFYELLGLSASAEEIIEHEQIKTMMMTLGETRIELLEASGEDSVIGCFVASRGEGIHHIAVRVASVDGKFAELLAAGVDLASDQVRVGVGGQRHFFVHPASAGGVLVEVVGE